MSKRLNAPHCHEERSTKGSHTVWHNPKTGRKGIIPAWGHKDLTPGTVRSVLRQLGISREEFGPIK
jgi:predicted RNA binding protein YcfA (HicA-like mRNA interferase family)